MKACIRTSNGPDFTDRHPQPANTPGKGYLLVKVNAAIINPVDYMMPRIILGPVMGLDFAGVVEAVHPEETKFKVGDEVYGGSQGSMAEYTTCKSAQVAHKPRDLSFEEAAALPIAYITGLQALRSRSSAAW